MIDAVKDRLANLADKIGALEAAAASDARAVIDWAETEMRLVLEQIGQLRSVGFRPDPEPEKPADALPAVSVNPFPLEGEHAPSAEEQEQLDQELAEANERGRLEGQVPGTSPTAQTSSLPANDTNDPDDSLRGANTLGNQADNQQDKMADKQDKQDNSGYSNSSDSGSSDSSDTVRSPHAALFSSGLSTGNDLNESTKDTGALQSSEVEALAVSGIGPVPANDVQARLTRDASKSNADLATVSSTAGDHPTILSASGEPMTPPPTTTKDPKIMDEAEAKSQAAISEASADGERMAPNDFRMGAGESTSSSGFGTVGQAPKADETEKQVGGEKVSKEPAAAAPTLQNDAPGTA